MQKVYRYEAKFQKKKATTLKESGYFTYFNKNINFKFNIGSVALKNNLPPHANTLAIELSIGKDRFIVNSGISTHIGNLEVCKDLRELRAHYR